MKKEILDDDLPPFLKDLKEKGDGLRVPEGYFEDLEGAVFARLEASGGFRRPAMKVVKRPGLFQVAIRPRAAMALAAAMALILAAVWFFCQPSSAVQQAPLASAALTEEDAESYLIENAQEFELAQLAALTTEEAAEPSEENTPGAPKKNTPSSDEINPDDLDEILDEMTDEELEQIF
ncbi:MAG: hypothetical protein ACKVUS_11125 [Saprospiraceae bacterium]